VHKSGRVRIGVSNPQSLWKMINETNRAEAWMRANLCRKVQCGLRKEVDQQVSLTVLECAEKKDGAQSTVSLRGRSADSVDLLGHRGARLGEKDHFRRIPPASAG